MGAVHVAAGSGKQVTKNKDLFGRLFKFFTPESHPRKSGQPKKPSHNNTFIHFYYTSCQRFCQLLNQSFVHLRYKFLIHMIKDTKMHNKRK